MKKKKLAVLASGRGTDFQAIADHQQLGIFENLEVGALLCNHEDAPVIERARRAGIKAVVIQGVTGRKFESPEKKESARVEFDRKCLSILRSEEIDLVALAGFDQLLSKELVDFFKFKILNIHPAYDLVKYGGKNMIGRKVHELVLKSGARYSGCTVHFVTNDIDLGPAVLKSRVEISQSDTPESLESKILGREHLLYPKALELVSDGRVIVEENERRCYVDLYSNNWDVGWNDRQEKYIEFIANAGN